MKQRFVIVGLKSDGSPDLPPGITDSWTVNLGNGTALVLCDIKAHLFDSFKSSHGDRILPHVASKSSKINAFPAQAVHNAQKGKKALDSITNPNATVYDVVEELLEQYGMELEM